MSNKDREINFAQGRAQDKILWQSPVTKKKRLTKHTQSFTWRVGLIRVRNAWGKMPEVSVVWTPPAQLTTLSVNFVRKMKRSLAKVILDWSANIAILAAAVVLVAVLGPKLVAMIRQPSTPDETVAETPINQQLLPINQTFEEFLPSEFALPAVDKNLPADDWLTIPSLGVNTKLLTNENSENLTEVNALLDKGVYMYPEFGKIGNQSEPVVLAAHHFNAASNAWRDQNTFQNLQQMKPGDKVELISGQRKWIYEVYESKEETAVTDGEADLIMYTCVYWWDNALRHVVYARLIDPATYDNAELTTGFGVLMTSGQ